MVIKRLGLLAAVLAFLAAGGCASIVSNSSYPVAFSSNPDQAVITITDEAGKTIYSGKTPTTVTLDTKAGYFKGKDYTVTFSKEGYASHTAQLRRGVDGWYIAGNIVFGGLIGWLVVDPVTGAMWTLPKEMATTLSPQTSSLTEDGSVQVVQLENVPRDVRAKMVSIEAP
jgi:hypothetical protein